MSDAVWLALIVGFFGALTTTMPWLLARQAAKTRAREKESDNARQDVLYTRTEEVRKKVERAADLLEENTAKVAASAEDTKIQLGGIHKLVNSDKTAGMQRELGSLKANLALMVEVVRLTSAAGREASPEAAGVIEATKKAIADLETEVRRRLDADLEAEISQLRAST